MRHYSRRPSDAHAVLLHYLLVQELDTLGFDSYMNCYRVENKTVSVFGVYSPSDLLDYHPLDKYMPFLDGKFYVRLKYLVIWV
jgi:hypothetical protein